MFQNLVLVYFLGFGIWDSGFCLMFLNLKEFVAFAGVTHFLGSQT